MVHVGNQFAAHADIAYLRHRIQRKDGTIIVVACCGQRYFDSAVKAYRSKILAFLIE